MSKNDFTAESPFDRLTALSDVEGQSSQRKNRKLVRSNPDLVSFSLRSLRL